MDIIQTNFKYLNPLTPLVIENIKYIILHHPEAITATPEQIHQWHLDNGWSGFGYNEYIRKDGTVYIGRGDNVGAQSYGNNSISYGICCEGDYSVEKNMPHLQFNSLVARVKFHKNRFPSLQKVVGHRELNSIDCPGKFFPLQSAIDAATKPHANTHWAKNDNDELLNSGILTSDHTETLDSPATEGMIISLVNRLRKG
jgi:N-acetylmuramoyl-L-alanine amidase